MKTKDKAALAALIFVAAAEGALAVGLLKRLQKLAVDRAAAMFPDELPEEEAEDLPAETQDNADEAAGVSAGTEEEEE